MTPISLFRMLSLVLGPWPCRAALALLATSLSFSTAAAITDIASEPVTTLSTVRAKPNLMFILDDSGSMDSAYMPDDMYDSGKYGFYSSQCNGTAYDPATTYTPPVDYLGTQYPNQSFSAAADDGFDTSSGTSRTSSTTIPIATGVTPQIAVSGSVTVGALVRIVSTTDSTKWLQGTVATYTSSPRQITVSVSATSGSGNITSSRIYTITTVNLASSYYYRYSGSQSEMGWTYSSTNGSVITSTTFYRECQSDIGNSPGSGVFTKVNMSAASSDATNYANWYAYYRKRYLLMRTAVGRAFQSLDNGYRVGFSTINDTGVTDGTNYFRDTKDFDATQKANFYNSLYSVSPGPSTPLRAALSKAGRYFANKISGQYDPMQYSCQRNFALLSTDGYWNSSAGYQLDGNTAIGNQDADEARPMRDNTRAIVTTVTPSTTVVRTQTDTPRNQPLTFTRYQWVTSSTKTGTIAVRRQTRNGTSTVTTSVVRDTTTNYNRTVVTTDGVVTSDTTAQNGSPSTSTVSTTTSPAVVTQTGSWSNSSATNRTLTSTQFDNSGLSLSSTVYSASCTASTAAGSVTSSACQFGDTDSVDGTSANNGSASNGTATVTTLSSDTTTGTPVVTDSTSGGSSNSLADVAEYYYKTDLRNSSLGNCSSSSSGGNRDVCSDTVPATPRDPLKSQHMNTYTVGLGVNGSLIYDKDYLTQTSGTYADLTSGAQVWPTPSTSGNALNIDDLWHAAVNGRGQYYSALNATSLSQAISGVVNAVKAIDGAASAAAVSASQLVAGDNNKIFVANYQTLNWSGEIRALTINGNTGAVGTTAIWSAQSQLTSKDPGTRNIYYRQSATSPTLRQFNYTNLSTDGYGGNFSGMCSKTPTPSQCSTLASTPTALTLANNGTSLVNYLRGERTYEVNRNADNPLFRDRVNGVLGDVINGAPVFVSKPPFGYGDTGYSSFASSRATRTGMLYAGANDGMLHAFNADTGVEAWAYVPTAVMGNMFRLANTDYATGHTYFVDGAPVVGDIKVGTSWKTILVGGLNAGGKAYYALDVTDPANPVSLWEFTDENLGLSYSNPIITKRADGTWIVVFASGYNNADGKGHLFVVNANTGAKLLDISTDTGTASSPSGLAKINAWIDTATDNSAKRFYGGDLLGNLWRFDIDNLVEPRQGALLLARLQNAAGNPEPITTVPITAKVSDTYPVVAVGTGKYLGTTDVADTEYQSIYAVKDPLTATGWGIVRDNTSMVKRTITINSNRISSSIAGANMTWSNKNGWWLDFPQAGERSVVNMALVGNQLFVPSAIPNGDSCTSGGSSWFYQIDMTTGAQSTTAANANVGALQSSDALIVGFSTAQAAPDSSGAVQTITTITDSKGQVTTRTDQTSANNVAPPRRTSWRELTN